MTKAAATQKGSSQICSILFRATLTLIYLGWQQQQRQQQRHLCAFWF